MSNGKQERAYLMGELRTLRNKSLENRTKQNQIMSTLWDTDNITLLSNEQLGVLLEEMKKQPQAAQTVPVRASPKKPQKPQKREILTLEDYAKQYDISKLFLTLIPTSRGGPPRPFILRAGLLWKMDKKYGKYGYEIVADPIKLAAETEGKYATFRGTVTVWNEKGNTRSFIDIATATRENAPFQRNNLDEMASTRATNRAMRLATAMGLCSVEEREEYEEEEHD